MKGTVTHYDSTRAVATIRLENGEDADLHAAAYLDSRLPAVGDEVYGQLAPKTNWFTVARRIKPQPALARVTNDKGETLLCIKDDKFVVEVAHCVHCRAITLAPQTDTCDCGAELYPVTRLVPLGQAIQVDQLKGG